MEKLSIEQFTIYCENREEALKIKQEIFTHHIYYFETENKSPVIIDAGAHIGLATLYFKKLYPEAQIIAIEPHPVSFALLQKNIAENYLENVTVINAALSGAQSQFSSDSGKNPLVQPLPELTPDVSRTFYADSESDWFSTASFHEGAWNKAQVTIPLSVPALSLTKVLKNIDKTVDLLKMDIEGAEQEVLTAARNNLAQVARIICEYHMTTNQNRENFIALLEKQGYQVSHENKKEKFHAPRQLELIEAVRL